MANVAQLINCLQSLFLANEDKFFITPTFHVFDMYSAHQGAQSIRTVCSAPRPSYTRNGQPGNIRGLSESASLSDKRLVLTVTNPEAVQSRVAEIVIHGAKVKSTTTTVLAGHDIHAHNSAGQPDAVRPVEMQTAVGRGGTFVHEFPPASVTKLQMMLE